MHALIPHSGGNDNAQPKYNALLQWVHVICHKYIDFFFTPKKIPDEQGPAEIVISDTSL